MKNWFLGLLVWIPVALASPECQQFKLVGEKDWPPFSYETNGFLDGFGVYVAAKLLNDLDIPFQTQLANDIEDVQFALRKGRVDMVVATLPLDKFIIGAHMVTQPIHETKLHALVRSDNIDQLFSPAGLLGQRGVQGEHQQVLQTFLDINGPVIFLDFVNNRTVVRDIDNRLADYSLGLPEHFEFLTALDETDELATVDIELPAGIFFAMAKGSSCRDYDAFFKGALKSLRASGWLAEQLTEFQQQAIKSAQEKRRAQLKADATASLTS